MLAPGEGEKPRCCWRGRGGRHLFMSALLTQVLFPRFLMAQHVLQIYGSVDLLGRAVTLLAPVLEEMIFRWRAGPDADRF